MQNSNHRVATALCAGAAPGDGHHAADGGVQQLRQPDHLRRKLLQGSQDARQTAPQLRTPAGVSKH